jgi:hypothetical protein
LIFFAHNDSQKKCGWTIANDEGERENLKPVMSCKCAVMGQNSEKERGKQVAFWTLRRSWSLLILTEHHLLRPLPFSWA